MPTPEEVPAGLAQTLKRLAQDVQETASSHANLDKCVDNLGSLMQQLEAAASKHQSTMAALAKQATAKPDAKSVAKLQEQQAAFNSQFLKLQTQMQREAQVITTVSNLMRTRHETIKNTIANMR